MVIHEEYFGLFVAGFCCTLIFLLCTPAGERVRTWWILRSIASTPLPSTRASLNNLLEHLPTAASQTRDTRQDISYPAPRQSLIEQAEEKIAVLTFYINPTDDIGIRATYLSYRTEFTEQDIPVFSAEVIFSGQRHPTENASLRIVANDGNARQYRERAFNALIEAVPREYEAVVWLDPGVKLLNPAWFNLSHGVATHVPITRLFQMAAIVDSEGETHPTLSGELGTHKKIRPNGERELAPASLFYGGAWVIRRSAFPLLKGISEESPATVTDNYWPADSCHINAHEALREIASGYQPRADVTCHGGQDTRRALPGHAIIRGIANRLG